MAKTVVFDRFEQVVFPHLCAGCLMPLPHAEMWITTGKGAGKSVAGKLALKAAWLASGLVFGAIGATALDFATGRHAVTAILAPVCQDCLNALSPEEKKQLDEASKKEPGDFFVSSVKNRILSCRVKGNKVHLTLENDYIATALIALNKDVLSEKAEPVSDASSQEEERNLPGIPTPTVDDKTREPYSQTYNRELTAVDLAIIDSWHSIVGKQSTIYTYPDIPERKLVNAKASYGEVIADEIVVGLQDSTVFGSAKEGMLFTTRSVSWKAVGVAQTGHVPFAEINTSEVQHKSGGVEKSILLGDNKIVLSGMDSDKPLKALVSFIIEASLLLRGSEETPTADGVDAAGES